MHDQESDSVSQRRCRDGGAWVEMRAAQVRIANAVSEWEEADAAGSD
jgi:hypothetical protein